MINCKTEFESLLQSAGGFGRLICARLSNNEDWVDNKEEFILPQFFTQEEYDIFLSEIDFEYNNGYGSQKLFGVVWFTDDLWSERAEYDGSERWVLKQYPKIPTELLKNK